MAFLASVVRITRAPFEDGSVLAETVAICNYMDETAPGGPMLTGKNLKDRATISMWPFVIGSNEPGYTATRSIVTSSLAGSGDLPMARASRYEGLSISGLEDRERGVRNVDSTAEVPSGRGFGDGRRGIKAPRPPRRL